MGLRSFERWLESQGTDREKDQEADLKTSLLGAATVDPDAFARDVSLGEKAGMHPEFVAELPEEARERALLSSPPVASLLKKAPRTAAFLSNHDNAKLAHDDIESLAGIEGLIGAPGFGLEASSLNLLEARPERIVRAFRTGQKETELGRLGYEAVEGRLTPEGQARIAELEPQIEAQGVEAREVGGFVGDFLLPAAKIAGQMYESGKRALAMGAVTGTAFGTGALAAGPAAPIAAPVAAIAGFGAGLTAGFLKDTMLVEGGQAYLELKRIRGDNGETIPEETARTAAVTVGLVNAVIEGATLKVVAAPFKRFLKRAVLDAAAEQAAQALVRPTVGRALTRFGREYGQTIAAETTQEVLQEVTNVVAAEVAKASTAGDFSPATVEEIGNRIWGIASETARAMVVLGPLGPALNLRSDIRAARAGERNRETFEALGQAAQGSRLIQRLPEKAREFVESVTAGGPLESIAIPVEEWSTYWQGKGVDPAAAAAEVLADPSGYAEALATGSDLVIPLPRYVSKIAGTEHHAGLVEDLRLRPGDMTGREAKAFRDRQAETTAQIPELDEAESASDVEVFRDVYEKLLAAARDPAVAQREATLTQSVFRSLGARAGVDPLELYQRYGLEITGPSLREGEGIAPDVSATTESIRGSQAWKDLALEMVEKKFRGKKYEGERPLLDRLAKMGRIHASGAELRGLNAWENGLMSLFTTKQAGAKGTSVKWDVAVRALAEEGYLAEDASLDDLVEAILSDREAKNTGGVRLTPGGVTDYEIEREAARRGYFQDAPPPVEHGDFQGWKYDGEYEDTGVHQYTDHDPNSPTFRETIAVRDPRELPAKIAQKRRQRAQEMTYEQPAKREPIASLSGDELGELGDDIKALRTAAADWYKENLQETFAEREDIGKVRFSGKGRKEFLFYGAEPDKLRMIVALKEIIEQGDYVGRKSIDKPRRDGIVAFHHVDGDVTVSGRPYRVRVYIGEDRKGNLFYQLSTDAAAAEEKERRGGGREQIPGSPRREDGGTTLDQSIQPDSDEVNITILAQEEEKGKRGFLRISPDRKIQIGLLEKADLSTFLHETGHFYLEVLRDLAKAEGAAEQVRADFDTLTRWLGIEGLEAGAAIPAEAQEKFAKAFEAYLFEGKAPSVELQSAFARFKAWLIQIYRDIKALEVRLNDDVRGVFDRLVATDKEISFAKQMTWQKPIFATAEDAGMTAAEFAAYRKVAEEASEKAREDLERSLIFEITRERSKWWVEEYGAVKAEVEEEAKKNPVFQAIHLLTRGELFDGTVPPQPVKLSKTALVEMYGKEFLKTLPRGKGYIYSAKGGMHPDVVAEMFGFSSGDEMISKISSAPTMKTWVEDQAHRRMKERHGDMQAEGTIGEEALRAVHTDASGQVLRAELRAIKRLQAKARPALRAEKAQARTERLAMEASIPPVSVFRENARKIIGEKKVLEILPHVYVRAEAKAGKAAEEALARQDFATAGEEKQRQLLNHFLYAEAKKAREDADKILSHMQQLTKKAAQVRLGKAGFGYLDQVNGILERYEFKPIPTTQLRRRESLLEWARRQQEQGLEPSIPDYVLFDARQVNYRTLSIENLRAVRDAVKTIEHLAMIQNQLLGEHAAISFDAARGDLLGALTAHMGEGKTPPLDPETRNRVEKMSDTFGRFDASLIKAEQLFDWFDAGAVTGPWQTYLFRPIAEAQAKEADLSRRYTEKILDIFETYAKAKGSRVLAERVFIEGIGESMTRGALLSVALNTGNEGNYFKLTQGHGWFDAHVEEMLSHLDKADWKFVQNVWDAIEELWPEIKALEERLTGIAPAKVQAREITNEHGTFRGGYYPVVYDSRFSKAGEKQEDARAERLFEGSYVRATTEKGHTKARADEVARPILLSLEVIPQHVAGVIHDLAFREPIVQANRLLNDARVRAGVIEAMGQTYHSGLNKWLASIANDRNVDRTGIEFWTRFMGGLRTNATIVSMGFKATTTISQIVGFTMSLDLVKGKYLGNAMRKFARHPFEATAWVREKSGEMRHRFDTMDRDVRDGIRKLQAKKGMLSWIQGKAFWGIGVFDGIVSVPTWMGAYEQAIAEGLADKDAIAAADKAVRLSQGSGGAKDLAAVQRNSEYMKLFTMFYSYFSALYSRQRHAVREFRTTRDEKGLGARIGALAWRSFLLVIIPATVQELLVARGPDDDEDPAGWAIKKVLAYPFMTIPFARDLVNALEFGRDYQMTPVAQAFDTTVRLARKAEQVAAGDRDPEDLLFPLIDVGGYAVGLPTAQMKITGRYIWDVYSGEEEVEDGGAFIRDLMFTRKRR